MMKRNIFPPTTNRVFLRTDPLINADIRNQTLKSINLYKNCSQEEITDRIRKLNLEWDTERILEANAATLVILSSILGIKSNRCWFLITGAIGAFLLQHALNGWCPPIPLIRKWGIRTADEINAEKNVLKLMRGDFSPKENASASDMLDAVEKQ